MRQTERVTYTGAVAVGGPFDTRVLDEIEIRKLAVGEWENNAYLLTCRRDGTQVLIDAAAEPDRLLELVKAGSAAGRLDAIVTTHSHTDHTEALASLAAVTGARLIAGADDVAEIESTTGASIGESVRSADVITAGHIVLEVIELRGHTPGSITLVYREPERVAAAEAVAGRAHLFTGDSLFPGGLGNTEQDPQRFESLFADASTRLFDRFDDLTWVYPGHGGDTTLGAERPHLNEWRERGW